MIRLSQIAPAIVGLLLFAPVGIGMIVFILIRGLWQANSRRIRTKDWRSMKLDKQGREDFQMELEERMVTMVNVGQPVWK